MNIPRPREATVNDMKSLEQQGASAFVRSHDINIAAIRQNSNPRCGKCGLSNEKSAQLKVQGAESVTSETAGNRCAEINKHRIGKPSLHFGSSLGAGCHRPRQAGTRYTQLKRQIHSYELFFETIHVESSNATPVKDDAFGKLQVKLPDVNNPNPVLKVKVDTGAQENILPLRIYRNMFLHHVDENGLPTSNQTDCIQWHPNTPAWSMFYQVLL